MADQNDANNLPNGNGEDDQVVPPPAPGREVDDDLDHVLADLGPDVTVTDDDEIDEDDIFGDRRPDTGEGVEDDLLINVDVQQVEHHGTVHHVHRWEQGASAPAPTPAVRPTTPPPAAPKPQESTVIPPKPSGSGGGTRGTSSQQDPSPSSGNNRTGFWGLLGLIGLLGLFGLYLGCDETVDPPPVVVVDEGSGEEVTPPPAPPEDDEEEAIVPPPVEPTIAVCPVGPQFERLSESLREYWSDFGPEPPPSCATLDDPAHSACLLYRSWYRNAYYCRAGAAEQFAGQVIVQQQLE